MSEANTNDRNRTQTDVSRFAYKSFRLQVDSPTSRFAYIEVVSPKRPSRFASTVWVDSPTLKSFRLHLQLELFCEDRWKSLPIVNQRFIFDRISS